MTRVAYYSPLPPERSGIADYSALLLPALSERVEIVLPQRGRRQRPPEADVALYHVGNDPDAHGWIVEALRKRRGVVVLHEFVLHHLVAGLTLSRGDSRGYIEAMESELGVAGHLIALGVLHNLLPMVWETQPERFPLATAVLKDADGAIVHSRYVEELVLASGFAGPVWRIPHPVWPVGDVVPADLHGEPLIGCFGNQNVAKRIPQLLEAFSLLRERHPGARLLLVGSPVQRFDLDRHLEGLDLGDALIREDYVPEERMWSLMAACDVLVNLRSPTMGETSGSVIRGLALGKPMLVSDIGWFAELPDDAVLKIPAGEHEVATIAAALELLAADRGRREAMGAAGRAFVEREHALGLVADAYAKALEEAAA